MASLIHIAEVAAILAVAYVLGWFVGYVAHRLTARPRPAVTAAVTMAVPVATVPADAEEVLVKAPVIEPVSSTPPASAAVPAAPPEAAPVLAPVSIPVLSVPPLQVDPLPERATPPADPEPQPQPEPEVVLTATPALRPGEAWSGEMRGRASAPPQTVSEAVELAPEAVELTPEVIEPPPVELPLTIDLGPLGADATYGEPIVPPVAPAAPVEHEPPSAPAMPIDEDAAMRAIEGGWSRAKTRAMSDASDVGAAVAAAQSAVEQVLAKAGIDAETSRQSAKPRGLPRPRHGRKDDLKQINGLGALDESTLNNLGVFHFDQIAGWSEAQVLWMENHVFARGRIGNENWQQQARALAPASGN